MEPFCFHRDSISTLKFFGIGFIPLEARSKGAADAKRVRPLTGFTLTELMVVLAIIATITTVTLTNQSSFNKTLVLANTAYDIALTLRSAETYGVGSRAIGTANAGYGLNFQKATPESFTLFADSHPAPHRDNCHSLPIGGAEAPDAKPGNCRYDSDFGEEVKTYALGNGMTVSDFCAYKFGSWLCVYAHDGYSGGLISLDIVFARPNPDPFINIEGTKACLTISSSEGNSRFISVLPSGAIVVDASSCP